MFEYLYEDQAEQFAFYRIPKLMFTDVRFKRLSTDAKVLYGLLLDRASLSRENGWIDDEGKVYIIFTIKSICEAMQCSKKSSTKYLVELEKFGLIERIKQKLCKPDLIYVKNFNGAQNILPQRRNNYSSGSEEFSPPEANFLHPNYTNNNNTDFNNTNLILSRDEDRMGYENYLLEQLEIKALKIDYPYDGEMIDGIVDLILDVLCSKRKTIQIAGDEKSVNVVKGRFGSLFGICNTRKWKLEF